MNCISLSVKDIKNTISTAQHVTNYAQASVTLVPKLDNVPSWFDPILVNIQATQANAKNWLSNLCPATTRDLPLTIAKFNPTFQTKSNKILHILNELTQSGKNPTTQQQNTINTLLTEISKAIGDQLKVADGILKEVKTYVKNVNTDQDNLSKNLNTITGKISSSAGQIEKVQATMGENFLDSSVMGPCNVVVTINFNISITIDQMNVDGNVLGYIFIVQFLNYLVKNVQDSQTDVEMFFDQWTAVQAQYTTLLQNLKSASADKYVPFIQSLDLQEAQKSWSQLTAFVNSTVNPN